LDAAAHLAKMPFIDTTRIYATGFSQGGNIALLLGGDEASGALRGFRAPRFSATAALYPACGWPLAPPRTPIRVEYLQRDIDRPVLLLMADGDNEVSIPFCRELMQQLKRPAPLEWHAYGPDVTHCWDCANLDNFSKTDFKGDRVVYRYNRDVTQDSRNRLFEFFARHRTRR
jgi:dienelactone hydrolase